MIGYTEISRFYDSFNGFINASNNFISMIERQENKLIIPSYNKTIIDTDYKKYFNLCNSQMNKINTLFKDLLNSEIKTKRDYILLDRKIVESVTVANAAFKEIKNIYVDLESLNNYILYISSNNNGIVSFGQAVFSNGDDLNILSERLNTSPEDIININKLDFPYISEHKIYNKNTLYPGVIFKYPIKNLFENYNNIDTSVRYGIDIKFDNNKINYILSQSGNNKELSVLIISGIENFKQSITRRLNTFIGEWKDNFGIPNIIDTSRVSPGLSKILIGNAIMRDDRIANINKLNFAFKDRQITVDLNLTLKPEVKR